MLKMPHKTDWSPEFIDPSTLIIQHEPRLANCVFSATTLIAVDNQTYSYHAKTGTLTNVTRISPLSIYEVEKPNTLTTPVIHELVMYNYSLTEKHIYMNSIMTGLVHQSDVLHHLGVLSSETQNELSLSSKVRVAANAITSKGLFGFLSGQALHANQVWVSSPAALLLFHAVFAYFAV